MKRVLLVAALLASACGGGQFAQLEPLTDRRPPPPVTKAAARDDESRPDPLKRKRRKLPEPVEARLSNGIRVLILEQHDFPAASVGFVVDRGAAAAPPEVAALYARAIRHGSTKTESSKEVRAELAWLGARMSSNVSQDAVTLSVTALSALLPSVLPRVCAMATTPTFDDESLTEARAASKSNALSVREDPRSVSDVALRSLLFPEKHPYGFIPSAGNPARFTQMSKNELENFRDMYVAADRLTVVAAGDVTWNALAPRLERCLAGLARKKAAQAPVIPAPAPAMKSRILLVPRKGASQANIAIGFAGVRRGDPAQASLAVLESLLGRALSGRLDLNIRGEHGYSYGVRMSTPSWRDGGMLEVTTAADSTHAAETVKGLLSELQRVQTQPLEAPELARAKIHAISDLIDTEDALDGGFAVLRSLAESGLPLRHYEQLAQKIEAITEDDVKTAAARFFVTETAQIVVVGDPVLVESLRALGIGVVEPEAAGRFGRLAD